MTGARERGMSKDGGRRERECMCTCVCVCGELYTFEGVEGHFYRCLKDCRPKRGRKNGNILLRREHKVWLKRWTTDLG